MKAKLIVHAAQIATPVGHSARSGRDMDRIALIPDGAVYLEDGVIEKVGATEEVLAGLDGREKSAEVISAEGKCVVPGFVDSHTHFIFAGYRPEEFVDRLAGTPYLSILKRGGGIQSTVKSTRRASFRELYEAGYRRMDGFLRQGVTTLEGKSGYGLDLETELRQLEVMKELQKNHPATLVSTYLGGHAVPPEFAGRAGDYIDEMLRSVLPAVRERNLARFCDVFCEKGVFSVAQSERLLSGARRMGFRLKIHADEISPLGGAELAGRLGAVSADHLLMASKDGIRAIARSGTVATLLPCTAFCLNEPYADAVGMIGGNCAVALASDYNPGSCFTDSVPLILALAVIHMHMSTAEALTALTLNGAAALGLAGRIGSIEPGKEADLLFLRYPDYRFLVYHTGVNIVESVMKKGDFVWRQEKKS